MRYGNSMSRIGKQPIQIPDGVDVKVKDGEIAVKGPKGELSFEFDSHLDIEIKDRELIVIPRREIGDWRALWGLTRSLVSNMVEGVKNGFEKKLEIHGVGYRARLEGKDLVLELGFSHLINYPAPTGIEFSIEKNVITVSGIDKQQVGHVAAGIRSKRKPEPYKGKGIRYVGEVVRRKVGKRAATVAT